MPSTLVAGATLSKVPAVTLGFWLIKILATTLGETGGDAVTQGNGGAEGLHLGYLIGTIPFALLFAIAVAAQIRSKEFHPFLYWAVIVATTTLGTTLADYFDRSLGIGYVGGSTIIFVLLIASLATWYWVMGSVSVDTITNPKTEGFYWATILFSQTLGTALGDCLADTTKLGYQGGALVFAAALIMVTLATAFTTVSRVGLFWTAFILTRPLGATIGDFLDKPVADGGHHMNRFVISGILALLIVALIFVIPQRAGGHPSAATSADAKAE